MKLEDLCGVFHEVDRTLADHVASLPLDPTGERAERLDTLICGRWNLAERICGMPAVSKADLLRKRAVATAMRDTSAPASFDDDPHLALLESIARDLDKV